MKVWVTGSSGYLGGRLAAGLAASGHQVLTERVELLASEKVEVFLETQKPEVILNAAGITGKPTVDWCESHAEETALGNIYLPMVLARAAKAHGIFFATLSSGCIYEGDNAGNGFTESDSPNFFGSYYSRTKIAAETALSGFDALQLRVRIPISHKPHSKNIIDKLIKYEKVISIQNSFTLVEDFVPATVALLEKRATGIFNMTNDGAMDHEQLLNAYKKYVDPRFSFEVMSLRELESTVPAKRSNCILNTDKRNGEGVPMPDIQKRLPDIMQGYTKALDRKPGSTL